MRRRICVVPFLLLLLASCQRGGTGEDAQVTTLGTVEVTAQLVEIPDGAIFQRNLYDYATVLKYHVLRVHRGRLQADTLYIAQYNPFRPRAAAADKRAPGIGGNLDAFAAGQVQRMALQVPVDDYYMGGIVNKYFGKTSGPIYWALWTNLASD